MKQKKSRPVWKNKQGHSSLKSVILDRSVSSQILVTMIPMMAKMLTLGELIPMSPSSNWATQVNQQNTLFQSGYKNWDCPSSNPRCISTSFNMTTLEDCSIQTSKGHFQRCITQGNPRLMVLVQMTSLRYLGWPVKELRVTQSIFLGKRLRATKLLSQNWDQVCTALNQQFQASRSLLNNKLEITLLRHLRVPLWR